MTDQNPSTTPDADRTTTEVVLPGVVEPAGLQVRTRTLPPPATGQALVAVSASGISFAEQQMRLGTYFDQPPFPFVPGYDLVGVVEQAGPGAGVAVGQRVAALTKTGALGKAITSTLTTMNNFGSYSNYIDSQINYNKSILDAQQSGLGALIDTDMAKESARLQALQIRQQLGTQALGIANQAPQSLVSLFRS